MIIISITKEHIDTCKRTIAKNSKEDHMFIKEIITSFTKLDIASISNIPDLEVVSDFVDIVQYTWMKYSKLINITRHFKSWWNDNYNCDLISYRSSKSIES